MTGDQAGEKIGLGRAGLSLWEKGERAMDVVKVAQLIDLYGVTADYILSGSLHGASSEAHALMHWFDQLPESHQKAVTEFLEDRMRRARREAGEENDLEGKNGPHHGGKDGSDGMDGGGSGMGGGSILR